MTPTLMQRRDPCRERRCGRIVSESIPHPEFPATGRVVSGAYDWAMGSPDAPRVVDRRAPIILRWAHMVTRAEYEPIRRQWRLVAARRVDSTLALGWELRDDTEVAWLRLTRIRAVGWG